MMPSSATEGASASVPAVPQETSPAIPVVPLNWKAGPHNMTLLDQAMLQVPQGFAYLEQDDARRFLRQLGNPNVEGVTGLLSGPGGNWLVVVRFNKVGYVRDSDVSGWNPDEVLAAINSNIAEANAMRQKNGVNEMEIVGWVEKPNYDKQKHRLIWAVSSKDKGAKETDFQNVNFNVVALMKEGTLHFNLVTELTQLEKTQKFVTMLASLVTYNDNKKYGDYKEGADNVAPYGLAGLVTGSEEATTAATGGDAAPAESRLAKFLKIFGLVLSALIALIGVVGGIFYMILKKRAAKLAIEVAAIEESPAAPPS